MAKYVVRKKKSVIGEKEKTLYYGVPVSSGVIDLEYIAKEICARSSLTEEDVIAAISAVARRTQHHLAKGDSVNLKGFGLFTVSASSEGCATPEECTPAKVKPQRVCFKADSYMRTTLANIKYELGEPKKKK